MRSPLLPVLLILGGCQDQQQQRRAALAATQAAAARDAIEKNQLARAVYASELAALYEPLEPKYRDLSMRVALAQIAATRPSLSLEQYGRAAYQAEVLEVSDAEFAHVYATVRAIDAFARRDLATAEIGLREVTKRKPGYVSAWLMLGDLLSASKRPQEAQEAFQSAARLEPANARAIANLGMLAAQLGDPARAVEYLSSAVDAEDTAGGRATLGNAYLALNQPAQAVTHLERAVELAPKEGRYRVNLGEAHLKLDHLELAARYFREALALDAEPWASRGLGAVALRRKDFAAAQTAFARVLAISPDEMSTLFLAAEVEEGLGHPVDAAKLYGRFAIQAEGMPSESSRVVMAKDRMARLAPVKK